jgi:iron(III) transport system substrate-binding protein
MDITILKRTLPILITAVILLPAFTGCKQTTKTLVVYTSVDQVYSEKIFNEYEKTTGVNIKPVYDIEASKSVGIANRIVAEKNNPQADVFWSGEILQTIDLKAKGVLAKVNSSEAKKLPAVFVDKDNYWFGFGGRARVLLYNKTLISKEACPKTMLELPGSKYIKQTGIANPVFGTASTQAAALYSYWGETRAKEYYKALKDAGITVLDGNSVVKDFVSEKKLVMGITDTDDALSEMKKNPDLDIIFLDQGRQDMGSLVVPNSVAKIKGAAHSEEADRFIEFLLSSGTEKKLVDDRWIQVTAHSDVAPSKDIELKNIKIMEVDFNKTYEFLEKSEKDMAGIFIR